jgi:uracil-DNA glycosylase family 4
VKHFKHEPRGKRRLHKKPDTSEIDACRWWLDNERAIVQPAVTVALGVTAARALMHKRVEHCLKQVVRFRVSGGMRKLQPPEGRAVT